MVFTMMAISCRERNDDPTIHSASEVEDKYLDLDQLGNVLKKLSELIPGMYFTLTWCIVSLLLFCQIYTEEK